jgi:hypothetical protein
MSANKSHDRAAHDPSGEKEEPGDFQNSGSGAASALERMKAEHALRRKHQHGHRKSGPGHEEPAPDR